MRTDLIETWAEVKKAVEQVETELTKCLKPRGNLEASMRLRKLSIQLRKTLVELKQHSMSYDEQLRQERTKTEETPA